MILQSEALLRNSLLLLSFSCLSSSLRLASSSALRTGQLEKKMRCGNLFFVVLKLLLVSVRAVPRPLPDDLREDVPLPPPLLHPPPLALATHVVEGAVNLVLVLLLTAAKAELDLPRAQRTLAAVNNLKKASVHNLHFSLGEREFSNFANNSSTYAAS